MLAYAEQMDLKTCENPLSINFSKDFTSGHTFYEVLDNFKIGKKLPGYYTQKILKKNALYIKTIDTSFSLYEVTKLRLKLFLVTHIDENTDGTSMLMAASSVKEAFCLHSYEDQNPHEGKYKIECLGEADDDVEFGVLSTAYGKV